MRMAFLLFSVGDPSPVSGADLGSDLVVHP